MVKYITIILFFLSTTSVFADPLLDSLQDAYDSSTTPYEKLNALVHLIDRKSSLLHRDNIDLLDEAFSIAEESGSKNNLAVVYQLYGEYYKHFGDFGKALDYLFKSLRLFEEEENTHQIGVIYRDIGETYRASVELETALEYMKKALDVFIKTGDRQSQYMTYNRIAAVYYEIPGDENKEQAIEYAFKSLNFIEDSTNTVITNTYNIIGAAYRGLGKYDLSAEYLNLAYNNAKAINDIYNIPTILINLVYLYIKTNEFEKAEKYAEECMQIAFEQDLPMYYYSMFDLLAHEYYLKGNFKRAFEMKEYSANFKDTVFTKARQRDILELKEQYESEKKEQELAKERLTQKYQIIISIVVILFIAGIALLMFFRNKETKKQYKIIEQQNKELKELNATKDKFFSIIAHDIRNPVGSFNSALELIVNEEEEMPEEEKNEYLKLIKESAANLYDLLDKLLTWSRSQRGSISFEPIQIDAQKIVAKLMEVVNIQAANKKIRLEHQIDNDLMFTADPAMVNTILLNLTSNAIKFTPEGGEIKIKAGRSNNNVQFSVIDSGIGMSQDIADKIFRIDSTYTSPGTNNEKGTGLGLIICKEFVDKHNGDIWVQSSPGKGAEFSFQLPSD